MLFGRKVSVRKGQPDVTLKEPEFKRRAQALFARASDSSQTQAVNAATDRLWQHYNESHKWMETAPLGAGFQDPAFEFGKEWVETSRQISRAQQAHLDPQAPSRFLLINGSPRHDQTCPGEISKSYRLCEQVKEELAPHGEVELLDLSRVTAEYGKQIHPCKSCVSTAMPLCHWPCSCYPNLALGQAHDWMNDIYSMWTRARGIMIITPVHWYSPPSVLKLLMDRLVCADGGNADPSTSDGKNPEAAKKMELKGWKYPKHLAGRRFSVVVHGDVEGALQVRQTLVSWLTDMGLESAGSGATLDRYVGYYEPYATSHEAFDQAQAFQQEVKNAAQTLARSVAEYRSRIKNGEWRETLGATTDVRPK